MAKVKLSHQTSYCGRPNNDAPYGEVVCLESPDESPPNMTIDANCFLDQRWRNCAELIDDSALSSTIGADNKSTKHVSFSSVVPESSRVISDLDSTSFDFLNQVEKIREEMPPTQGETIKFYGSAFSCKSGDSPHQPEGSIFPKNGNLSDILSSIEISDCMVVPDGASSKFLNFSSHLNSHLDSDVSFSELLKSSDECYGSSLESDKLSCSDYCSSSVTSSGDDSSAHPELFFQGGNFDFGNFSSFLEDPSKKGLSEIKIGPLSNQAPTNFAIKLADEQNEVSMLDLLKSINTEVKGENQSFGDNSIKSDVVLTSTALSLPSEKLQNTPDSSIGMLDLINFMSKATSPKLCEKSKNYSLNNDVEIFDSSVTSDSEDHRYPTNELILSFPSYSDLIGNKVTKSNMYSNKNMLNDSLNMHHHNSGNFSETHDNQVFSSPLREILSDYTLILDSSKDNMSESDNVQTEIIGSLSVHSGIDSNRQSPVVDLSLCIKTHYDPIDPILSTDSENHSNNPNVGQSSPHDSPTHSELYITPSGITHSEVDSPSKAVNVNLKQSLFSRALSCKPRKDPSRKERVANIQFELFKSVYNRFTPIGSDRVKLPVQDFCVPALTIFSDQPKAKALGRFSSEFSAG